MRKSANDGISPNRRNAYQEIWFMSQETLKRFLTFATGSPVLPEFGLGTIQVKFDDGTAIFCIHLSPKSDIAKEIPRQ